MATELERMAGNNASLLIADTDARTGLSATSIYVREDTVISVMTGTDESRMTGVDFKTSLGLSGKTLKANDFFCVGMGDYINAITLTSGSIIVY